MEAQKYYDKVFFEIWRIDGYKGRWIYSAGGTQFSEEDIPSLYEKRPHKNKEGQPPDYLYRIDDEGIHIGLFYDGVKAHLEKGKIKHAPKPDEIESR